MNNILAAKEYNIVFKKFFPFDESSINVPIMHKGKQIGIITNVNSTHVFGTIHDIDLQINKIISFEIQDS